jgi:CRP-like cAMP-binding protein
MFREEAPVDGKGNFNKLMRRKTTTNLGKLENPNLLSPMASPPGSPKRRSRDPSIIVHDRSSMKGAKTDRNLGKSPISSPRHAVLQRKEEDEELLINALEAGSYFGEIALLTNFKRTCTVRAYDYCTLAQLDRKTMAVLKEEHPSIYLNFYEGLDDYQDAEMELRRQFIRNVPYLRKATENTISQVLYSMNEKNFNFNSYILRQGNISNKLYILWKGEVSLYVTDEDGVSHHFDTLNEGSCFCVYTAFKADTPMLFDFKVTTNNAVLYTIKIQDLETLSKKDIGLADEIKRTKVEIIAGQKSEFDYFRFLPPLPVSSDSDSSMLEAKAQDRKEKLRFTFRTELMRILNQIVKGEIDRPIAMDVLNNI